MKILFSILHLFLQGRNDNSLIIIIYIGIDFAPARCPGQHSVTDKLIVTREETVSAAPLWPLVSSRFTPKASANKYIGKNN